MTIYRQADHYSRKAQAEGLSARSAFKLDQIDQKHDLFKKGGRFLDLGCRPGSWSQWIRRKLGSEATLVGIDVETCQGYPGTFHQASIEEVDAALVAQLLGGAPGVVLSDMAPATSGARDLDHLRQIALAEAALALAVAVLPPGGAFVCKVFDGRDGPAFVEAVRAQFAQVRRHKPPATRSNSREFFLVGEGFVGRPA